MLVALQEGNYTVGSDEYITGGDGKSPLKNRKHACYNSAMGYTKCSAECNCYDTIKWAYHVRVRVRVRVRVCVCVRIYTGVPGGMDKISGECSLR